MKKLFFYYSAMLAIILTTISILLITYWLIAPYTVLTFGKDNAKLLSTTVKSGGYLQIQRDFCKHMAIPAKVGRKFLDSLAYDAVLAPISNEKITCKKDILYVYISKGLPLGKYYLRDTYEYRVNPIRTIQYTIHTDFFTVVGRE